MIAYLDTSAFVPLIIREAGTATCQEVWRLADHVVSSRLLYVEASAALAQASRLGRLTAAGHGAAVAAMDSLWSRMDVVGVDAELIERAAKLAHVHALRGYDAVHCASAELMADPDLVAVAGDRRLLDALSTMGLDTVDASA